jgi:sugar (pentulose or hexulose) kinase
LFDVDASAIGAGAVNVNQACLVVGSWSINEVITRDPIVDPGLFMTTLFAVPGLFLTIEGSATSATNLEWFVNQCCGDERAEAKRRGISVYEVCSEEVATLPPGRRTLFFTHSCMDQMCSRPRAQVSMVWLAGIRALICCAHFTRALCSDIWITLRNCVKLEVRSTRRGFRAGDHAARSGRRCLPIRSRFPWSFRRQRTRRGVALAAGVSAGIYRDYEKQFSRRIWCVHEPIPANTPLYTRYAEYERLLHVMQAHGKRSTSLSVLHEKEDMYP